MPRRNPPVVPADTTPEAWQRHTDAIASRSMRERLAEFEAHNRAHGEMVANGIRRRHPEYDDL